MEFSGWIPRQVADLAEKAPAAGAPPRGGGAVMTPAGRPLPLSFETWLALSSDDEILELLRLVVRAAERRRYVPRCEWVRPA